MKHLSTISLFLCAAIFFSGCRNDIPLDSAFGIRHDRTLADYEDIATNMAPYNSEDYPDFSPVIAFSYSLDGSSNFELVATGTLVKSDWILTAGHNFYIEEEQSVPALPAGIEILFGNNPNDPDDVRTVEELVFHPTWLSMSTDFIHANDLCLVKLSSPISDIIPAELHYENTEQLSSNLWYCGFGDYSEIEGQDQNLLSNKHAIENNLDRKVDQIVSSIGGIDYNGGLLAFDFDDPSGEINSLGDDISNEDENRLGSGTSDSGALEFEGTTVQGDSGGPLFLKSGDKWLLAGILSGGASDPIDDHVDGDYGDISVFIRVSSHKDWIQSIID